MSDALTRIMNLPCTGFDNDGEETVNREAAAEIAQELEIKLAQAQNVAAASAIRQAVELLRFMGWCADAAQSGEVEQQVGLLEIADDVIAEREAAKEE